MSVNDHFRYIECDLCEKTFDEEDMDECTSCHADCCPGCSHVVEGETVCNSCFDRREPHDIEEVYFDP